MRQASRANPKVSTWPIFEVVVAAVIGGSMWFRKAKETHTKQIHDLEVVWSLLQDISKLSLFYNLPSAVDKILDAAADVRKQIDSLKRTTK